MKTELKRATSIAIAPLMYMAGRALGRPEISAKSIDFDPHYFRGYHERLRSRTQDQNAFSILSQGARLAALCNAEAGDLVLKYISKAHGQLLQDIMCIIANAGKQDGYFVEVGVGDGTKYSNTLLLERDFGWKGILAEPARSFHADIARTRSAILDKRAVFATSGKTLGFEEDEGIGELSGLSDLRRPRGQQSIASYSVTTVTLDDMLAEHNAPDVIDFMSIDTEGSEVEVLNGLSLDKRRVSVLAIEHNHDHVRWNAYRDLLLPKGYRPFLPEISGFDSWFLHEGIINPLVQQQ